MEKVTISLAEYDKLKIAYAKLKELEGIDMVRQIRIGLNDLGVGRVRRVV